MVAWNSRFMWKLIAINSVVIALVIWTVGVSVTDYACLLVDQSPSFDQKKSAAFTRTMQSYLVDASAIAIFLAAVFHYLVVYRMLKPMRLLTVAARQISKGEYPEPLKVVSKDEIGELTIAFNEMMAQLKKVESKRNAFMRDIAHELRTPLTNIHGYLEALSTGVLTGDQAIYESLYEETSRLTRLVEKIRQLNAWKHPDFAKYYGKVLVEDVVNASVRSFRLELEEKAIKLQCRIEPGAVWGDADGLKQVLDNLLHNAIQYDTGHWIDVTGEPVGRVYRITVTNEGQPIPPDQSDDIFERFHRVDLSRSRETGGTGLGLAIVKEIVRRHGGEVGLRTDPPNRHAFWFTIPLFFRYFIKS